MVGYNLKNAVASSGMFRAALRAFPTLARFSTSWMKFTPYDIHLWEVFYGRSDDPYEFSTDVGEDRKYAFTIGLCGDRRYRRAFEVGCSIGVFTAMLAARCDSLLAVDISATAVERARQNTAALPHVSCARLSLPEEMPSGPFDLVVCSDVLYHWPDADLRLALCKFVDLLEPGGRFVAIHYLGPHWSPSDGATVHKTLRRALLFDHVEGGEKDFRLNGSPFWRYDVFEKRALVA